MLITPTKDVQMYIIIVVENELDYLTCDFHGLRCVLYLGVMINITCFTYFLSFARKGTQFTVVRYQSIVIVKSTFNRTYFYTRIVVFLIGCYNCCN